MVAHTKINSFGEGVRIPLKSDFINRFYETTHGKIVSVPAFRPKSVQTVYQYADKPITPSDVGRGNHSKASILLQLARRRCLSVCTDSWLQNTDRLCKIRYYYRLPDTSYNKQTTTSRLKPSSQHQQQTISRQRRIGTLKVDRKTSVDEAFSQLSISGLQLKTPTPSSGINDEGVNTDPSFYSLAHWHGAKWQKSLPEIYLPRQKKYNSYASTPVRRKLHPSQYRSSEEMMPMKWGKNSASN